MSLYDSINILGPIRVYRSLRAWYLDGRLSSHVEIKAAARQLRKELTWARWVMIIQSPMRA